MKRYWFLFLLLFFVSLNLRADDPWKAKSYKQWDQKEVQQVLTSSPWARQVTVANTWSGSGGGGAPASGSRVDELERTGSINQTAMGGPSRTEAAFVVRWVSARTVRQAFARGVMLRGQSEAEAEKVVAQEPDEYQLAVLGVDMTPFSQADEKAVEEMKAKTFLQSKKTKARIAASSIRLQRSEDGKKLVTVYFTFPKKSAGGELSIPADEKSVEFNCSVGKVNIKTTFELSKMTGEKGVDL